VNFALKGKFVVKLLSPQNINLEGPRFLKIKYSRQDSKNLRNPSSKISPSKIFGYMVLHIKAAERGGQLGHFALGPTLLSSLT